MDPMRKNPKPLKRVPPKKRRRRLLPLNLPLPLRPRLLFPTHLPLVVPPFVSLQTAPCRPLCLPGPLFRWVWTPQREPVSFFITAQPSVPGQGHILRAFAPGSNRSTPPRLSLGCLHEQDLHFSPSPGGAVALMSLLSLKKSLLIFLYFSHTLYHI